MGLDLGIRCRGIAAESVLTDSDAAGTVATDRPVVGYTLARMVGVLALPPKKKYLTLHFFIAQVGEFGFN